MAEESRQNKSLEQLRQEIAHSRDRLARDLSGLRYELDFPLKIRKSFQRKTVVWISAAAVAGIVLSVMARRTKTIRVEAKTKSDGERQKEGLLGAGLTLGLLKIAATVLRPVVIRLVTNKLRGVGTGPASTGRWS
jgi:hypothetical protein